MSSKGSHDNDELEAIERQARGERPAAPAQRPKGKGPRRGSASYIASKMMAAMSRQHQQGSARAPKGSGRGGGGDLLVGFPSSGEGGEEPDDEEYTKPVTRRPGQAVPPPQTTSSPSGGMRKVQSVKIKGKKPAGGRRGSFGFLQDLIFGAPAANAPTEPDPEEEDARPVVHRPGGSKPVTYKPGARPVQSGPRPGNSTSPKHVLPNTPVPQPALSHNQVADDDFDRPYRPTVDAMSKGGEAARLQARQVEQAKMGTPQHRPLVGGFAAAAYEAAREYHYVHAKEEERVEIVRPRDRRPPPSI